MEDALRNYDSSMRDGNVERLLKKTKKCNQCNYASSNASHLKRHLKTHSGEKLNKCNQCDYASALESNLKRHLKTHSVDNRCVLSSKQFEETFENAQC